MIILNNVYFIVIVFCKSGVTVYIWVTTMLMYKKHLQLKQYACESL